MAMTFGKLNEEINGICSMPQEDPRLKGSIGKMQMGICATLEGADLTPSQKEQITTYVECYGLESGLQMTPEVKEALQNIGRPFQNDNVKTL